MAESPGSENKLDFHGFSFSAIGFFIAIDVFF
jgi:hypothetical protein